MSQRYSFKNQSFVKYYGDEPRVGTVELEIDWDAIVKYLGMKAAYNGSRKSKLSLGLKAKFIPTKPTKGVA